MLPAFGGAIVLAGLFLVHADSGARGTLGARNTNALVVARQRAREADERRVPGIALLLLMLLLLLLFPPLQITEDGDYE